MVEGKYSEPVSVHVKLNTISCPLPYIFCRIFFPNIVTIVTQSSVFIKNRVSWLLGNKNKEYAYLNLLV